MIDASIIRRMQTKRADELHMQLCAKIEQAVINAAMDSFNELLVQLQSENQRENQSTIQSTIQHSYILSIPLKAYDIERLQFCLKLAGYVVDNAAYTNSFIIKW